VGCETWEGEMLGLLRFFEGKTELLGEGDGGMIGDCMKISRDHWAER
jgi:hypothetical protein